MRWPTTQQSCLCARQHTRPDATTWIQIQTPAAPGIIYLTTLFISLLTCETGVITILQMDFMKTECDNACKVFSILPGTLQALNKY